MKKTQMFFIPLIILTLFSCQTSVPISTVIIKPGDDSPQLRFAVEYLKEAFESRGMEVVVSGEKPDKALVISFNEDKNLEEESYKIESKKRKIKVYGGDLNGLMYAGIDLAEAVSLGKDIQKSPDVVKKPFIRYRGLRFNIPLDARTPSYDDTGDAAQKNISTVWDMDFWKQYLDHMALNRYNLLTLWNCHPYPSWVRVPEYPDVALDNVCVYNKLIDDKTDMRWRNEIIRDGMPKSWRKEDIQNPENLDTIIEITMDEKISFWKEVFEYAENRGIEIYLFHWNVFVYGAEGKHGIEWSQQNDTTMDYIRKSVKTMLLTYPNIKGIGVTAGENVDRSLTGKYKIENWMFNTYGKGVIDAKAEKPDLDVRFIFRRHQTGLDEIASAFKKYPSQIETSFKYSRARMYSSTNPPWFDKMYREDVIKYGTPCWLNLRNDDIFIFRWGDPEYAREYIYNLPLDQSPGFYMGPDGYVWGREFVSLNPQSSRQLEVDKHWYRFRIWGRLAYDPELGTEYWQDQIRLRFPDVDAEKLYLTWKNTSEIISLINKIHYRQNDKDFLPEGCLDRDYGFHDVDYFIKMAAMPLQGVMSISDYARKINNDTDITPFEVAGLLDETADKLLKGSNTINAGSNYELEETLTDFEALAWMGRYYADKIRGSTYTAMYRYIGDETYRDSAVTALEEALEMWKKYASVAGSSYKPQLFARTRTLDWYALTAEVEHDIEIARNAKFGESIEIVYDNRLWE